MTAPQPLGLLRDGPSGGAWNMAVDEVLLQRAAGGGGACWRFYTWCEPTLSLGYFQDYATRRQHAASGGCPAVRRLTGGGAILHDAELTYSLVLPRAHAWAGRRDRLYQVVHQCLVDAIAELGVLAHVLQAGEGEDRGPLLCFQRRAPGDVLLGDAKIAGSAQRRRSGAVLQHGSLLLRRSAAAPELPGLEDMLGRPLAVESLADDWLARIQRLLGGNWADGALSAEEAAAATALAQQRYGQTGWTERREGKGQTAVGSRQ